MTFIEFKKDSRGNICGFTAQGHSGYNQQGGDIVCAIISTITQAVIIGLSEVLKLKNFSYQIADGYLHWEIKKVSERDICERDVCERDICERDICERDICEKISHFTRTMEIVLLQAKEQYGDFLSISEKIE